MAGKIKTWIWVILGAVIACVATAVVLAGSAFYFFSQHIETHSVTAAAAEREFASAKARFNGQKPLVELDRHGTLARATEAAAAWGDAVPAAAVEDAVAQCRRRLAVAGLVEAPPAP